MSLDLYGFKFSVYAWIARFALHEKGVDYNWIEVNPFADDVDADYWVKHPFCRVPTLAIDDFILYETGAITRFIDAKFEGSTLLPTDIKERARVDQAISIVDSYTYWPLVRQVFSHDVMGPRVGRPFDPEEVTRGLSASSRVLGALSKLASDGEFFVGHSLSLADIHLAPMISYFTEAEGGRAEFAQHDRLQAWWSNISSRQAFIDTKPDLPKPVTE